MVIPVRRYNDLNNYFRNTFGCRVQKIAVDAGLTCPNRDGTIATGGCIYCNALGSGTGFLQKGLSLSEQISRGKKHLARRYKAKKFMVYFQSFPTHMPLYRS
jgi:radical SAM superfamily enzyme